MSPTRLLLMLGVALPLAACGADNVASPGIDVLPPAPAPGPAPGPGGQNTPQAAFVTSAVGSGATAATITVDEQFAVFNGPSASNNVLNGTNPLSGIVPNGAAAFPAAFNVAGVDPFFQQANYVGAINPNGDTTFQGWTCNSSTVTFGAASANCATSLNRTTAAPAAAACPGGTTDAGTLNNYRLCNLPAVVSGVLELPRVDGVAYQLNGRVDVGVDRGADGSGGAAATLGFAAGVIVVSNNRDAANDFLVVNRGSQINARGTAQQPIIFTSGQNLNPATNGDASQGQWGGIVLAGRSPISNCANGSNNAQGSNAACNNIVEGTVTAQYGGATQADTSGTMQFVQIRFSGVELAPGNELQGLTLAGVGSGTTLNNIQIHNSADDGVEIFGGTVNLRNIAVTGADDDGFDTDVGWRGLVQFLLIAQKVTGATSDSFGFEIDSNGAEDALPRQFGQIANFTVIQTAGTPGTTPAAIRLRGGADYAFYNGIVRSVGACINMVGQLGADGAKTTIRPANTALQDLGPPIFRSNYFACNGF